MAVGGRKIKRCCGVRRGPSEAELAKAFLHQQAQVDALVLDARSDAEVVALLEAVAARTLQDGRAEATRRITGAHLGMSHRRTAVTRGVGTPPWDLPRAKHASTVLIQREAGCGLPVGPTPEGTDSAHGRGCQSGRSGKSLVPLA